MPRIPLARTTISITLVVGLLAIAVVAVIYATREDAENKATEAGVSDAAVTVTITGRDIWFDPADLQFAARQPVRLIFVNAGAVPHDVSILGINVTGESLEAIQTTVNMDGRGGGHDAEHAAAMMPPGTVHLAAAPGESVALEFTPAPGTFEVLCMVTGHREAGMVGKAIVT